MTASRDSSFLFPYWGCLATRGKQVATAAAVFGRLHQLVQVETDISPVDPNLAEAVRLGQARRARSMTELGTRRMLV